MFARRLIVITVQFLLLVNINIIFSRLKHFPQHAGWPELQIGEHQPLHVTVMSANGGVAVSVSASLIARKREKMGNWRQQIHTYRGEKCRSHTHTWSAEVEVRLNMTRIEVCSYLTSSLWLMKASSRHGIVYPLKILWLPCNFQLYNLVPRATNTTLTFAPCNRWRVFLQGGIFHPPKFYPNWALSDQSGGCSREYRPGVVVSSVVKSSKWEI